MHNTCLTFHKRKQSHRSLINGDDMSDFELATKMFWHWYLKLTWAARWNSTTSPGRTYPTPGSNQTSSPGLNSRVNIILESIYQSISSFQCDVGSGNLSMICYLKIISDVLTIMLYVLTTFNISSKSIALLKKNLRKYELFVSNFSKWNFIYFEHNQSFILTRGFMIMNIADSFKGKLNLFY